MGTRGPIPKRDEERRRQNKPERPTETITAHGTVRAPAGDPDWCRRAKALWREAKRSPMAQYYEGTDWQAIAYLCDLMTTLFRPGKLTPRLEAVITEAARLSQQQYGKLAKEENLYLAWMMAPPRPSAQMVAAMNSLMGNLGLTEGDRRRMRIEIKREKAPRLAAVTVMDTYKDAFGGGVRLPDQSNDACVFGERG
ncbi:MAG: hypothetical protein ABFE07_21835 [Armatimonadia bacterium]